MVEKTESLSQPSTIESSPCHNRLETPAMSKDKKYKHLDPFSRKLLAGLVAEDSACTEGPTQKDLR